MGSSAEMIQLEDVPLQGDVSLEGDKESNLSWHISLKNGAFQSKTQPLAKSNAIRTHKYPNTLMFILMNGWEQITRPGNLYFIFIGILQCIPPISISEGRPSIGAPFAFILGVTAIKDWLEDRKRALSDKEENLRLYQVYQMAVHTDGPREFVPIPSEEIAVGDMVKLTDGEVVPADMLVMSTAEGSYCYVETSQIDGESSLKIKTVPEFADKLEDEKALNDINIDVNCLEPNGDLDSWRALLSMNGKEGIVTMDNMLLRGSKIQNSREAYGVVVYTGENSKIRMNSTSNKPSSKRSKVETLMYRQMATMVGLQIVLCLIAAITCGIWQGEHLRHDWYLRFEDPVVATVFKRFGTWFIIFYALVPISLLVTMELVKFWQGTFIGWDVDIAYKRDNDIQFARAQTSTLNEELGGIHYILSDKTGTLTCNSMDFRKAIIGHEQFGTGDTDISRAAKKRHSFQASPESQDPPAMEKTRYDQHVNFNARETLLSTLQGRGDKRESGGRSLMEYSNDMLRALALCNTVFPTIGPDDTVQLKAGSPDEECLVSWSRFMGVALHAREPPMVHIKIARAVVGVDGEVHGTTEFYEQLALLDFTPRRKRMSVIVRCKATGNIRVLSKGADSEIQKLIGEGDDDFLQRNPNWDYTMNRLEAFGADGLRTLLVAVATHPPSWWDGEGGETAGECGGWGAKYHARMKDLLEETDAEKDHFKGGCQEACRRCALENEIELDAGLYLVGATAIEDKLQEKVPETISMFLQAGMNVWVLTGDKMNTAVNIGMACNLLESSMVRKGTLLTLDGVTHEAVTAQLEAQRGRIQELADEGRIDPFGLVLSSKAYACIQAAGPSELRDAFLWVATRCKSVVGCRMAPNQKADIVQLIKDTQGVTTLAIGDGANDEQMIRTAHVGVGIRGAEGTTAVRAADYAISQFHFMQKLLFVYGRLNYRRVSVAICYLFYKNVVSTFIFMLFGVYSGFSGHIIFLEIAFQLQNIAYTGLPIFVFAVLDYDRDPADLLANPALYARTAHGELFNGKVFWKWIMHGIAHGFIIFFCCKAAFGGTALDGTGQSFGLWSMGFLMLSCQIVVVNAKLMLEMRSWTWLHYATLIFSIGSLYVSLMVLANPVWSGSGGDYTGLTWRLLALPKYWLTMLVTCVFALLFDYFIAAAEHLELFSCWRKDGFRQMKEFQEESTAESHAVEYLDSMGRKTRVHTGFAFDAAPDDGRHMSRRSSKVEYAERKSRKSTETARSTTS